MTTKPPKSKTVEDQINKTIIQEIDKDINQAYNDLFSNSGQNYQLPEQVFVDKFLPYFAGKVQDDPRLNITTHWVAIAGSAMNPVDVVNPKGEVLYTVPPLMSSDFLRTSENIRGQSFNEIFTNARQQANRIPVLGDRAIANQSSAKLSSMKVNPEHKDVSEWNKIFDRYHIDHPKTSVKGQSTSNTSSDDELDFD